MYTLDINFLSDRAGDEAQAIERQPIADSQFLVYGGAVAVVALAPGSDHTSRLHRHND